jgi:magnesium-transporting ATPase (P-type)
MAPTQTGQVPMTAVVTGLTTQEAMQRLAADGLNQLPEPRGPSALRQLGRQFTHLLALLLWVASGLALLAGQPPLAAAIVVVIVLNALFAFAQEYRADRSAERLQSMLPMSARVRRDGTLVYCERVRDGRREVRADAVAGAFEDPPRQDVADALVACRQAGIKVAMITGDHPGTAVAVAREVGLLGENGVVLDANQLPSDDDELAANLDHEHGVVVARVMPEQKLRIARVLRRRGHVVAMTGDGVNDAPALREADVGVAMGLGGSDVAKAAADLVHPR